MKKYGISFYTFKTVLLVSGLALLPIVAILCGVAVGLGTVALGVVLLVRGRTHEEDSEGTDSRRPGKNPNNMFYHG